MKVEKIVLTGGPGAGKTASLSYVRRAFEEMGYAVVTIPETATELMSGGVAPWTCGTRLVFQRSRLKLQMEKEKIYEAAARSMAAEKVLIVCDRGALDTRCYTTAEQFAEACKTVGMTEVELRDSYGAVFHLISAGKGAKEHYLTGEGTGRRENADESAALDDRLISAWCGHPHYRIIGCEERFEDKMAHLIKEIAAYLGEPEPREIERKYLIKYPDVAALENDPFCKKVEIEQTYILTPNGGARIRRRGANGDYIYFLTEKRDISATVREEIEKRITENEYKELLKCADPERHTLKKTRYCLVYGERYYEIDVFPFWNDRAILEIEFAAEDERAPVPPVFELIREVTGEAEYRNYAIAAMA